MKKLNVIPVCCAMLIAMVNTSCFAGDTYEEAMKKNIAAIYHASEIPEFQEVVNIFERISAAEDTKWEPPYYAAFGYIMMANREMDKTKKDAFLDKAMTAIEKAKVRAPRESEIIALEGFVYMVRVTIDPGSRGPEFAPMAMRTFAKATELNPENPRALALTARMQYGSAQFFGNSTTEACSLIEKALAKFETYQSRNPLAPAWGKPMAESLKQQCP
jgi:hypothetical protein